MCDNFMRCCLDSNNECQLPDSHMITRLNNPYLEGMSNTGSLDKPKESYECSPT